MWQFSSISLIYILSTPWQSTKHTTWPKQAVNKWLFPTGIWDLRAVSWMNRRKAVDSLPKLNSYETHTNRPKRLDRPPFAVNAKLQINNLHLIVRRFIPPGTLKVNCHSSDNKARTKNSSLCWGMRLHSIISSHRGGGERGGQHRKRCQTVIYVRRGRRGATVQEGDKENSVAWPEKIY